MNPKRRETLGTQTVALLRNRCPKIWRTHNARCTWRNFQSSDREQREVLDTLLEARDDLQQARTNLAETEEEQLDAALDQIESWAAQMEDIQRELEAMDNQENTANAGTGGTASNSYLSSKSRYSSAPKTQWRHRDKETLRGMNKHRQEARNQIANSANSGLERSML